MEQQDSLYVKGDIYGYVPKMFIDQKTKFRTAFGSFLSFVLFGFIMTAFWVYGKDLYYKANPNSIFTEEGISHPERYKVQKDNLNFCFGLQDAVYQHYIDPTIYNIKLYQSTMVKRQNSQGQVEQKLEVKDLNARPCKPEDFGITQQFFHGLWLDRLYCPDDYSITELEGDYGADIMSFIGIDVLPCKNSTESQIICKPQHIIEETLDDNYWAYYTTDYTINPKNFTNPFQDVGRNVYGVSSYKMFTQVDFNYRNIYIEDNVGLLFDDIQNKQSLQYQGDRQLVKLNPQKDGTFLKFLIRLEAVRQTRIYRTFISVGQIIANVGGIMKVFMIGFMFISNYVASKFYYVNVLNSIFRFNYSSDKKLTQQEFEKKLQQKLFFRKITHLFCDRFAKKHVKIQKDMLKYSVNKLAYQLDVKRLLQKMMEIDKLKLLLLDEQQVKLFEYIPKQEITEDMVEFQKLKDSKQKKKNIQNKLLQEKQQKLQQKIQANNYLFEDHRTSEQKKQDAFAAFKYIHSKASKKHTDKRILDTMDQNLKKQFQEKIEQSQEHRCEQSSYNSSMTQIQKKMEFLSLNHSNINSNINTIRSPIFDQDFLVEEEFNDESKVHDKYQQNSPKNSQNQQNSIIKSYLGSQMIKPNKQQQNFKKNQILQSSNIYQNQENKNQQSFTIKNSNSLQVSLPYTKPTQQLKSYNQEITQTTLNSIKFEQQQQIQNQNQFPKFGSITTKKQNIKNKNNQSKKLVNDKNTVMSGHSNDDKQNTIKIQNNSILSDNKVIEISNNSITSNSDNIDDNYKSEKQ